MKNNRYFGEDTRSDVKMEDEARKSLTFDDSER